MERGHNEIERIGKHDWTKTDKNVRRRENKEEKKANSVSHASKHRERHTSLDETATWTVRSSIYIDHHPRIEIGTKITTEKYNATMKAKQ